MFPLYDSIKAKGFPIVNYAIIAFTVFVFFLQLSSPESFTLQYALIPGSVNFSDFTTLFPFISSIFLHGGFFHIISNMWFLHIFGDNIEDHIGSFWYLVLYLASGIAAGLGQYITSPNSSIPMLGASGAVSGVLGAYFVLFPHSRIHSLVFLGFIITTVNIPAVIYLFYWFIIQLFSGFASLPNIETGGVAFWAHVGGFVVGFLFAQFFKRRGEQQTYIEGEIVGE